MKAAWYTKNGSARDVLQVGHLEKPEAGPGQVLVRVHAIGVNPSDTKARTGIPLPVGVERIIPHQDGAGVIEAVGDGISPSRIGESVWMYEALYSGGTGCAAEYVAVPSANAVYLPDVVPFEIGACLGVPALTAHRCVYADGPVNDLKVLVTGGAGAVGAHAIQFAKHGGATVFTTVSNERQVAIARAAGADVIIDRTREDQVTRLGEWVGRANERIIDRVIDVAFGANLDTTMKVLKENGVIATYSSDAKPEPTLSFFPLLRLGATIRFIFVYNMSSEAHQLAIEATNRGLQEGWLQTTIAARFTLDQIEEAHEFSESSKSIGKVVILVD
ncbi:NADPH:quinone reductase [Tunturiibacter empetritectus]|uniref:NADPH2:quinone reductase n=1 Tax=Tunturiibacter lichenicola TaxID=2051959 RepID=A0A852VEF1_9BACT|nr:NADPH:quinone reductase [Edaphobacter lichenicola]NYF87982.1 NADPH2:quinone reductase [Edaphobacter lichenicola]